MIKAALAALAMLAIPSSASANQWVLANVKAAWDNSGYSSSYGLIVDWTAPAGGTGTTSNGPSVCIGLRIVVGLQGITEEAKARYWGALLTQKALNQPVAFYVDTTGPYCAVQVLAFGVTTVPKIAPTLSRSCPSLVHETPLRRSDI